MWYYFLDRYKHKKSIVAFLLTKIQKVSRLINLRERVTQETAYNVCVNEYKMYVCVELPYKFVQNKLNQVNILLCPEQLWFSFERYKIIPFVYITYNKIRPKSLSPVTMGGLICITHTHTHTIIQSNTYLAPLRVITLCDDCNRWINPRAVLAFWPLLHIYSS